MNIGKCKIKVFTRPTASCPIAFWFLALPKKINFDSLGVIEYIYGANGEKLKKKVIEGSENQTVDYLGGFSMKTGN